MIPGLNKPLRNCSPSDLRRHSEVRAVRSSLAQRKYSIGLMEEALKLFAKMTLVQAAKLSGVNPNTLKQFALAKRVSEGTVGPSKSRIPHAKKQVVYSLAMALHQKGFSRSMRKCWIEAGRRVGISGRTVEFQYVRGLWKP